MLVGAARAGRSHTPAVTAVMMLRSSTRAVRSVHPPPHPHSHTRRSCSTTVWRAPWAVNRSRNAKVPSAWASGAMPPVKGLAIKSWPGSSCSASGAAGSLSLGYYSPYLLVGRAAGLPPDGYRAALRHGLDQLMRGPGSRQPSLTPGGWMARLGFEPRTPQFSAACSTKLSYLAAAANDPAPVGGRSWDRGWLDRDGSKTTDTRIVHYHQALGLGWLNGYRDSLRSGCPRSSRRTVERVSMS